MKRVLNITFILLALFCLTGCAKKEVNSDALKFKEEYESINGVVREKDGKTIRTINIDENNPFVYKTAGDIVSLIDNKESFLVYFGFKDCPWCRSMIPYLIEVAKEKNINKIYYVDVKDIRDTLEVGEKNKIETVKKGTDDYYKLLEKLDSVLEDYTLKNSKGKEVETNEKRIYAPNIVAIKDGNPIKLESGNSDMQTDGYMELSDEIIKDMKEKINCVVSCLSKNNTCSKDKC